MVAKDNLIEQLAESHQQIEQLVNQADHKNKIYHEWQHTQEQLKIVIHDLPPEKMEDEIAFPWGQTGNVEDLVIGLTKEHEAIHARDIKKSLSVK